MGTGTLSSFVENSGAVLDVSGAWNPGRSDLRCSNAVSEPPSGILLAVLWSPVMWRMDLQLRLYEVQIPSMGKDGKLHIWF